jgi:hypothetical protein
MTMTAAPDDKAHLERGVADIGQTLAAATARTPHPG